MPMITPEKRSRAESIKLESTAKDPDWMVAANFMKKRRMLTESVSLAAVPVDS